MSWDESPASQQPADSDGEATAPVRESDGGVVEQQAGSQTALRHPSSPTICVVGLGYVGLPLALAFDRIDASVTGYDVDQPKIARLRDGVDPAGEVGRAALEDSAVDFTADPAVITSAEYVIITVPTPIDEQQNPNLSFVESAAETVGGRIRPGTTVVLESTVFPGMTREVLIPALESASGMVAGEDFRVGYSPERISPGEEGRGISDVVKIVSGLDQETLDDVAGLYEQIVDAGVHRAPDIETAEAAKVIENVQRDVNIALVNELAIICHHLDLDTHAVLEAARTKWNFHGEYRPGLVGGHCIPVDPLYLVYRSRLNHFVPRLILQAREINEYMPEHAAELALKQLNASGNVLRDSRLLILGLAYKANTGDFRTSQATAIAEKLQEFDVEVVGYDPHADVESMREHFEIEIQDELSFDGLDGVIIATPHDVFRELDLAEIAKTLNESPVVIDVTGLLDPSSAVDNGFSYARL